VNRTSAQSVPKGRSAGSSARSAPALRPTVIGSLALVLTIALAAVRVLVPFQSTDSALGAAIATDMTTTIGRTGTALADGLAVLAAALAVIDAWLRARPTDRAAASGTVTDGTAGSAGKAAPPAPPPGLASWITASWMLGGLAALTSAWLQNGDPAVAMNWIGATGLAVAAFHLAGHPGYRRVMLIALVALLLPLGLDGLHQYTWGHDATVENWQQNRERIMAGRGWSENSIMLRKFEHRLFQREATGPFGLSNVYGSVMAVLTLLAGGAGLALRRRGRHDDAEPPPAPGDAHGGKGEGESESEGEVTRADAPPAGRGIAIASLGLAAIGGVGLALSHSKGATATLLAIVAGLGVTLWISRRRHARPVFLRRCLRVALIGALLAANAAIGLRGLIGPPDEPTGERSMLFRYHYLQASTSMLSEQPMLGVAPGRFQDAYAIHKNPIQPETVDDPHHLFATWLAGFGVGGLAWIAMVGALLVGMTRRLGESPGGTDTRAGDMPRRWTLGLAVAVTMLVYGTAGVVQLHAIPVAALLVLLTLGVTVYFGFKAGREMDRRIGLALPLAVGAVLIAMLPLAGIWACSAALTVVALASARRWAHALDHPAVRWGWLGGAAAALLHAQIEMNLTHIMSAPLLWLIVGGAAGWGAANGHARPSPQANHPSQPPRDGITRWLSIGAIVLLVPPATVAVVQAATAETPPSESERLRERIGQDFMQWRTLEQRGRADTEPARHLADQLADHLRAHTAANPHGLMAHVRAGDVAWHLGRGDLARRFYRRALEIDANHYLDPLSRLPAAQRQRIEQRLANG